MRNVCERLLLNHAEGVDIPVRENRRSIFAVLNKVIFFASSKNNFGKFHLPSRAAFCKQKRETFRVFVSERTDQQNEKAHRMVCFRFGDPYGNRTHVTAVKGRCLNLLTNGPVLPPLLQGLLVAEIGLEPMTYRV